LSCGVMRTDVVSERDPSESSPLPTRRILVVDDDETLLVTIGSYFRDLKCTVEVAQEPEEAIALIRHRRYDLVILDLGLAPLRHGDRLEILRDLREREPRTCVVVLSALSSREVEEEAMRLGANAVLRKPQALPSLAQTVFDLMRQKP
jgi:CheY-like chemotaxis protein